MKSDAAPSGEGAAPTQGGAGAEQGQLEIQHHVSGGRHTIRLSGELDIAVAGQVERLVRQLVGRPADVVIDLDRLESIDSAGLRGIVACGRLCQEGGGSLEVILANPRIRQVFESAGLLERPPFTCVFDPDQAGGPPPSAP